MPSMRPAGAREGHGYQRPVHWSADERECGVDGNGTPDHRGNYTHFIAGGSVRAAGGRSGDFFLTLGQFRF
jgi:hypothetical protein